MAQLILTEEEKASDTHAEWTDEALGVTTRYIMVSLRNAAGRMATERGQLEFSSVLQFIVGICDQSGYDKTTTKLIGYTHNNQDRGDWVITIERVNPSRFFRTGHMKRLLTRFWRWLVTDPNPNDPDRDSTAWN